jgi:hypothetical protein
MDNLSAHNFIADMLESGKITCEELLSMQVEKLKNYNPQNMAEAERDMAEVDCAIALELTEKFNK